MSLLFCNNAYGHFKPILEVSAMIGSFFMTIFVSMVKNLSKENISRKFDTKSCYDSQISSS